MAHRYELRLAGEGGQGLILAGLVLAEAAALYDGQYVAQTQAYGPQVRGGVSRSEVVISSAPIDYPLLLSPDLLLALNQEAFDRYHLEIKRGGLLIVDATHVKKLTRGQAIQVPISDLARETTGLSITANILSLGLIAGLTGVVSRAALESAVRERAPRGTVNTNLKALAAGLEYAQTLDRNSP